MSHAPENRDWAERLRPVLAASGLTSISLEPNPGSDLAEPLLAYAQNANHILVLIGPRTRFSRWVDQEIEVATACREDGPGAAALGLILPIHDDFERPYYDPENVPIRLHDLTESGYALIRKWSEKPDELAVWLAEAEHRRQRARPEPSFRAAAALYRFSWDDSVDAPDSGVSGS